MIQFSFLMQKNSGANHHAETEDAIKDELGDYYVRVASIGLAGEKLSKIASIINEKTRAAGRTGLGAVMGSKNLKAIAVRGTNDIVVAKPEEFMEMVKEFHERMKGPAAQKYRTLGHIRKHHDSKRSVLHANTQLQQRSF